jgi:hypothetical protein
VCGNIQAQTGIVDGPWEFQVQTQFRTDHIVIDFRTDGGALGGTITRSDPPGQMPANLAGAMINDRVSFTVRSPDGLRTITMHGIVTGDTIHFTRAISGTHGQGPGDGFFGLYGPDAITATRIKP